MLQKIVKFVQYNNFFTLTLMFIFMGASATFAANPEVRQSILAQKETVRSVDNTYIVNTDFSAYDVGLKVVDVKEDIDWYYIDYTYNTAEVVDYVWKQVPKSGSMKVTKKELANRDLGLYVAEQLGQVTDQQLAYLKDVQEDEKKIGATQKIVAIEYSGLIGQFLSTEEKTFDGYKPVKPPVEVVADNIQHGENNTVVGTTLGVTVGTTPTLTRDEVQNLIQDTIKQLLSGGVQSAEAATTTLTTNTSSSIGLSLSTTPETSTSTVTDTSSSTNQIITTDQSTVSQTSATSSSISTTTDTTTIIDTTVSTTATTTP